MTNLLSCSLQQVYIAGSLKIYDFEEKFDFNENI